MVVESLSEPLFFSGGDFCATLSPLDAGRLGVLLLLLLFLSGVVVLFLSTDGLSVIPRSRSTALATLALAAALAAAAAAAMAALNAPPLPPSKDERRDWLLLPALLRGLSKEAREMREARSRPCCTTPPKLCRQP